MATYVTSDAHGHLRALDRALELAQPSSDDALFVLGDMVDRGPDPLGVVRLVRSLPNVRVLMGNHEAMLLQTVVSGDSFDEMSWHMNGGYVTSEQLDELPQEEYVELIDWLSALPAFSVVEVEDRRPSAAPGALRPYLLTHAGVDPVRFRAALEEQGCTRDAEGGYESASVDDLVAALSAQSVDDLLWIRSEFWSEPTGLVGRGGAGPVVVAGHTPSILLRRFARLMCGDGVDDDLRGVVVEVGPTRDTGGVADRICIDCSAAAGYPSGRVGVMRLEDGRVWYADVEEGA